MLVNHFRKKVINILTFSILHKKKSINTSQNNLLTIILKITGKMYVDAPNQNVSFGIKAVVDKCV